MAFGIAALGMIAVAVFRLIVLLPSSRSGCRPVDRLRAQVFIVSRVVVGLIVLAIVVFELFDQTHLSGPAFAGSVATLRVLMLGALPWGIYMSLRTIIDARHKRAVNAINVAVSFAFFVAVMLILRTWMDPATAVVPVFVISLYLLGALTVTEIWRITHRPLPATSSGEAATEDPVEPIL